jgi:hypothetical protein
MVSSLVDTISIKYNFKHNLTQSHDIVGQLSKDTLASIEFIRLSDYDRHDVATDVATELLVYALYKTGAEVTDIRLFIEHRRGNP